MKRTRLKTGLISDFFSSGKSQKSSSSSSPHVNEPEVEIIDQIPQTQEDSIHQEASFIPHEYVPEEQTRENGSNDSFDEEYIYDVDLLPIDPGKRISISDYPLNDQDAVRRGFIGKGACQPRNHDFPRTEFGTQLAPCKRKFIVDWYAKYPWLEYSIEKDAAFCFVCYLFKDKTKNPACDTFVAGGFRGWSKAHERFLKHFGQRVDSAHKQAQEKFDFFINPRTSIVENFNKTSKEVSVLYKRRLTHSVDCLRYLLRQGLAFRGHDESETSNNRGNFLELLKWLASKDENVNKIVLKNAPPSSKLICSTIQRDIIHACAEETTKLVLEELGDNYFGILADESSDVSHKEQLAICLRFVDKDGQLCERFLGVVKVGDTSSLLLKNAIKKMIEGNLLSMSKIRGQGYDGASNMRGGINGLKTLIMKDTPSAYYIHCFAHQLQLTLVAVARDNYDCKWFFEQISYLLNLIGVSCKRKEMLRVVQAKKILESLDLGVIKSGQGLNQELGLARPGDTRWGSYYRTISNVIALYPSIFEVLLIIGKTGHSDDRLKAQTVMLSFESFQFVFMAHLMLLIFGYTDQLCQALQKRDQDIVNAMTFVRLTKNKLLAIRNDGWEEFIGKVSSFCAKHDIEVPDMDTHYAPPGRSRRYFEKVKNLHRFRNDIFISIVDLQLEELNNRFDEVNMELLMCMACFNPVNSFAAFNKEKLVRLATKFYSDDFSSTDLDRLEFQLDHFYNDMLTDGRFEGVKDLGQLSRMLVTTNKHSSYELVYRLLRLVLILPVATASVERVFSAMTYVKNKLRNSMGDELLNDTLVTFIERDLFSQVPNDDVIDRFQARKTRTMLLPEGTDPLV